MSVKEVIDRKYGRLDDPNCLSGVVPVAAFSKNGTRYSDNPGSMFYGNSLTQGVG